MSGLPENRFERRYGTRASITYSLFSTKYWHYHHSKAWNHSRGGMFFKSDSPLSPGATIYIRTDNIIPENKNNGAYKNLRTVTLAQVRWCKQLPDGCGPRFGIGVKYY